MPCGVTTAQGKLAVRCTPHRTWPYCTASNLAGVFLLVLSELPATSPGFSCSSRANCHLRRWSFFARVAHSRVSCLPSSGPRFYTAALSRDVDCGFCCGFMPPARTLLSRSWLLTALPGRFSCGSSPLARCFSRVLVSLTPLLARAVALTLLLARATKNFFSRGALTAPR